MLSRNEIKFIHSLALKKRRDEEGLFVAEGPKLVSELLGTFRCRRLIVEEGYDFGAAAQAAGVETDYVGTAMMERATLLTTPHQVIAVFDKPQALEPQNIAGIAQKELCLALDGIQNPGNLGTIVRTADWMGIRHIFCSEDTADIYSPKALQATMGSAARVRLTYTSLPKALEDCGAPVWGTFLDGDNIWTAPLEQRGVVVIGNEGKGISAQVAGTVTRRLFIPPYPPGRSTAESLNAGIATAITLAAFRQKAIKA